MNAGFNGRTFLIEAADGSRPRIYVKPVLKLLEAGDSAASGMAHITGGGLTENIPRVLPENVTAVIDGKSWSLPPLFQWLQQNGNVEDAEMHRVFNCGIGMVVIVAAADADKAAEFLRQQGETVYSIGKIEVRAAGQHQTVVR